ncbi:MAG: hypothetical protein ACXWVI_04360 [Methyloceanibacter sp.]
MRPDVVWFGEMPREMDRIYEALVACDLFISMAPAAASIRRQASWPRRARPARIRSSSISSHRRGPACSPRRCTDRRQRSCPPSSRSCSASSA